MSDPDAPFAVGWATVDLERALAELRAGSGELAALAASLAVDPGADGDERRDGWLGARCRILGGGGAGPALVLLEPDTEGRLAATLARFGEGSVVRWVRRPPDGAGLVAGGSLRPGPFGPEGLVASPRPWGPHLLVVPDDPPGA
jgi:hypothetical protein